MSLRGAAQERLGCEPLLTLRNQGVPPWTSLAGGIHKRANAGPLVRRPRRTLIFGNAAAFPSFSPPDEGDPKEGREAVISG